MTRREVTDVQRNTREPHARMLLPLRQEPVRDPTLIEHFDRARMEAAGSRFAEILRRASLNDDDVDPRQRELARQHHPGRTAARDHY